MVICKKVVSKGWCKESRIDHLCREKILDFSAIDTSGKHVRVIYTPLHPTFI